MHLCLIIEKKFKYVFLKLLQIIIAESHVFFFYAFCEFQGVAMWVKA